MRAPSHPSQTWYPALGVVTGVTLWGVIWYPMRLLEAGGLHGLWLTAVLYATALLVSLPRTLPDAREFLRYPLLLLLFVLTAGWCNVGFIAAVLEGNVLRVLLLFHLSPLWATLMAWIFLGERISRIAFASLALAMGGALVMLWHPSLGLPWPQGRADWMALSAGFCYALSNVIARKTQGIPIAGKVFYVWFGGLTVALAAIGIQSVPVPQVSAPILGGAAALGLCGVLMTVLMQYGFTHMPVYQAAVLGLIELVAGAISQQLLTTEIISPTEWAGGALIMLGSLLAARAAVRPRREGCEYGGALNV